MKRALCCIVLAAIYGASALAGPGDARTFELLDRYLRGEFDAAITTIEAQPDLDGLANDLHDGGGESINAGGPAARDKRRLAAATFALEAARLGKRTNWKRRQPLSSAIYGASRFYRPAEFIWWQPPALLVEWGCRLFRDGAPTRNERLWQLAALTLAERANDYEFLAGALVGGASRREIDAPTNAGAEIEHLKHVRARFPDEMRFELGAALALEMAAPNGGPARAAFTKLQTNEDVGGEATLRLGQILARTGNDDRAIETFDKVETRTLDPWVLYLARYLKGQALERKTRSADAEAAYRGAVAAVPGAESASVALAAMLFKIDRRMEASNVAEAMLAKKPPVADPARAYPYADDRFWPELRAQLRAEIQR